MPKSNPRQQPPLLPPNPRRRLAHQISRYLIQQLKHRNDSGKPNPQPNHPNQRRSPRSRSPRRRNPPNPRMAPNLRPSRRRPNPPCAQQGRRRRSLSILRILPTRRNGEWNPPLPTLNPKTPRNLRMASNSRSAPSHQRPGSKNPMGRKAPASNHPKPLQPQHHICSEQPPVLN